MWGALAVTSGANLAICWDVRPLSPENTPYLGEGVQNSALVTVTENATDADNQQGSPRDPSTTVRQASELRMMIQSELPGDREP